MGLTCSIEALTSILQLSSVEIYHYSLVLNSMLMFPRKIVL